MVKVSSPNKSYTGVSASVAFSKGTGFTEDKHLIEWFKGHGYKVEEIKQDQESNNSDEKNEQNQQSDNTDEKSVDEMTIDELKAYAEGKGIDLTGITKKDDILSKIKAGK